ncbi:MAG TPA: phosphatase PAP2 family protein [Ktedonobacteraceae bacterium]
MISILKMHPEVRKWLILASALTIAFLIYCGVYATGVTNIATLEVERWLVGRPESRVDCVLSVWRNLGEVPATVALIGLIGIACILGWYRKRVLPLLLLLLLLAVGVETVGKAFISIPLPNTLRSGMTNLTCPQMDQSSNLIQLELTRIGVALGMINLVPPPSQVEISWSQEVSQMPLDLKASKPEHSFPGGHAIRWSFIWLLVAWLAWRHIRPRFLSVPLTALLFVFAFVGGFIQFYIGVHFISDTIAGYLFGGALACCAIAILQLNDTRKNGRSKIVWWQVERPETAQPEITQRNAHTG